MTYCEKVLWQVLRKNQTDNLYFRRQHPISRFIVDFYCHELRLVIEVDGSIHDLEVQQERDSNRTAALENFGIKVVRFKNNEIIRNIKKVTKQIVDEVKNRQKQTGKHRTVPPSVTMPPPPQPSPKCSPLPSPPPSAAPSPTLPQGGGK